MISSNNFCLALDIHIYHEKTESKKWLIEIMKKFI